MKYNTIIMKSCLRSQTFIAFALCILCAFSANGQNSQNMPTNLLEPAPGPNNYIVTESPEIGENNKPTAGTIISYQHRPFVTLACDDANQCGDDISISQVQGTIDNVEGVLIADLLFGYNFLKRFQAGIGVPIYIWQTGFNPLIRTNLVTGQAWMESGPRYNSYGTFGDLRLHLKGRIWGREKEDGFVVSAAVIPTLPLSKWTGQGEGNAGADSITVTPKGMVSFRKGPFRAMANLGFKVRKKIEYFSAEYGHAITFALGGSYLLPIKPDVFDIEFFGEIYGEKNVVSDNFLDMESAPLLFDGGAKFKIKDFQIIAGVGGGIISGIGVPQFQGMLGFNWALTKKKDPNAFFQVTEWDIDGDGIDNDRDECPKRPEDIDNFQDEDGCPDDDNDNDGVPDGYDSCVNEPEDKDNFRDDDGCPDLDHDEDGIKEPTDQCPNKAEDYDNFEDEDGCPEEDNDKDGVPDDEDLCPKELEDADGFEDSDGCPDLDNDEDGIPDTSDKCPGEKETLNGVDDEDGCPDPKTARIDIAPTAFIFAEEIRFKYKKPYFKDRDITHGDLDIIALVLKGSTKWKLTIVAHTDATEDATADKLLTEQRAATIKDYLVKQGIDAARLNTEGKGGKVPLLDNATRDGRAQNNRVDFVIDRPIVKKPAKKATAQADKDDSMDFTEGEGEETMDFSVEEDTMDFSDDEI